MVKKVKLSQMSKAKQVKALRKRWLKRRGVNVNMALQPIPQRYICKMKYADAFTLNATTQPAFRFNLNSIFDPNRTGTGHQPYSHDTFATLYNRYRVISASWVITAYSPSSPIRLMALTANEEVGIGSPSEAIENPRCKFIVQYPGGNTNKLTGKISLPKLVGRTKAQYMADDRYQAAFGSSPAEFAILNIFHGLLTDSYPTDTVVSINITYRVELFDVKNLTQS